MTDPNGPPKHPGLQPGERAPDFVLPREDGGATTFYEAFCGMPAAILLADGAERFADWPAGRERWLAVVPGPPGQPIDGKTRMIGDDGRLRRALIGSDRLPSGQNLVALVFEDTLRMIQRVSSPTADKVERFLSRLNQQRGRSKTQHWSAPVLIVPGLLSVDLCHRLIAAHDADNAESGMVRMVDGKPASCRPKQDPPGPHPHTKRPLVSK